MTQITLVHLSTTGLNNTMSSHEKLKDLTKNVIIGPTIALKYPENVGPRNKGGSF